LPKLLDVVKELGLSHDDAIKLLKETATPPELIEEEEEKVSEEEEEESADDEEEESEDKPETIQVTKEELNGLIKKAVEDSMKAYRKTPSKGKKVKVPKLKPYSREDMFERII
jgi:hypothetical protein